MAIPGQRQVARNLMSALFGDRGLCPTFLYISPEAVIPALFFNGVNSSGKPAQKYWIPPYQVRGRLNQAWKANQRKETFDAVQ
jgi:hypothetical protein